MVRAGGSASRIIGDCGATDPGGGKAGSGRTPAGLATTGGGHPWNLPGPQMSRPFRPWGATLLRMLDGVNVQCRITIGDAADGGTAEFADLHSGDGRSDAGDAAFRSGQVVAAETCSGLVGCEAAGCREASIGGGAGVFSRDGPTDLGRLDPWPCPASPGLRPRSVLLDYLFRWWLGWSSRLLLKCILRRLTWSDDTSVVRVSEQRSDHSWNPKRFPGMVDRPVTNLSSPEPIEHSVLGEDLDGRPMEELSFPEPLEHLVLDEDLDGKPMEGLSVSELLEHSVLNEDLDGRPMEGLSVPEPLEHSRSGRRLGR